MVCEMKNTRSDAGEATAEVPQLTSSDDELSDQPSTFSPTGNLSAYPSQTELCDKEGFASPFEKLPTELLQKIASETASDLDFSTLTLSCPSFAHRLISDDAGLWRKRFLARYDYPVLQDPHEFALAYKIRRFVLRKLDGRALALGHHAKALHQLLVMKDMIMEAYNKSGPLQPYPRSSKNLAAVSSPHNSPWILALMGCSLFANEKLKFGRPNLLFDTIQVTLSHLVLSQRSAVALQLPTSRDNYDLARVYNYNRPFALLLQRLPDGTKERAKSRRHDILPKHGAYAPRIRYAIDMHTLLHIRNFWQRHFHDDMHGIGENTYASMARALVTSGKTPQKWDHSLHEYQPLHTRWIGHYSCLHPWPKSRGMLDESQSCAEDWSHIDPLTLELEASASNTNGLYWPPAFSTIPALSETLPDDSFADELHTTYFRGIAPFSELKDLTKQKHDSIDTRDNNTISSLPKWHRFLASRVHGVVHDTPDATLLNNKLRKEHFSRAKDEREEQAIPGWRRIIMIMYKPTIRQMVAILEHAEEDYGGPGEDFNTADIWNPQTTDSTPQNLTDISMVNDNGSDVNMAEPQHPSTTETPITTPTEDQIHNRLKNMLARRISSYSKSYHKRLAEQTRSQDTTTDPSPYRLHPKPKPKPAPLPPLFSPTHIRQLEESYSEAQYMTWDDGSVDYAYAYEGIVIPGGKIMLGRYWRIHGAEGMGPGREVGPDAVGVEVRPVSIPQGPDCAQDEDDTAVKKGKRKATSQETRPRRRRRSRKKGRVYSHDANVGDGDADHEDDVTDHEEDYEPEPDREYEFVTMLNGEESRAVNGCKGLERGPFVFWTM